MTFFRVGVALLLLIVATWLGILLSWDGGYVIVGGRGWDIQTELWSAVVALLVLVFVCYVVIKLIKTLFLSNRNIAKWFTSKRTSQAHRQTIAAVEAETNGDTVEAIRLLEAAGRGLPNPLLHFLRASELASRIGAYEKSQTLREEAVRQSGDQAPAFSDLATAMAVMEGGNAARGASQLKRLLEKQPHCAPALVALIEYCLDVGDWQGAMAYVDVLSRLSYASDEDVAELLLQSWVGLVQSTEPADRIKLRRKMPKQLQENETLVSLLAEAESTAH